MDVFQSWHLHFLRAGTFCLTKQELLEVLDSRDREILTLSMQLCADESHAFDFSFDFAFEKLFTWCRDTMSILR